MGFGIFARDCLGGVYGSCIDFAAGNLPPERADAAMVLKGFQNIIIEGYSSGVLHHLMNGVGGSFSI